jgi:5'-AMP-activated protein kinase catalytic alpha subunit
MRPFWKRRDAEEVIGNYKLGATIGKGTFGVVRAAEHCTSKNKVAIKITSKATAKKDELLKEIRNHLRMKHRHVVQFLEAMEHDGKVYLVLELVAGGDLFDYIVNSHPRLRESEARRIFQQIVAGVEHCHERGLAHRDLKPENIFMDANKDVKIGDFGLSAEMSPGALLTDSCGSPNYAAPELLQKGCQYEGPEVDVWAMGVILYALLCGSLPFDAIGHAELFRKIKKGSYSLPGHLSPEAADLIRSILVVDPTKRARISEIWNHPWFQKNLPLELAETKVQPLPNLLLRRDAAVPTDIGREDSKRHGTYRSSASLEKKILAERVDTPQRSASTFAFSTVSSECATMPSECNSPRVAPHSASGLDVQYNSLSHCHAGGYSMDAAMYIFSTGLVL